MHDPAPRHAFSYARLPNTGWRLFFAGALTWLVGCTAAPLPALKPAVPQAWRHATATSPAAAQPDLQHWWGAFNDPQLDALVQRALDHNLDVKAASQRLLAVRALYRHTDDPFLPNLRFDTNQVIQPDASASYFIVGFDALWELPLFGALKSANRVAAGNLGVAKAQWQSTYVTLVAEVARCWIGLRSAQEQVKLLTTVRDAYREKLRLLQVREGFKLVPPTDVASAQAAVAHAEMALTEPQRAVNANAQQLAVLLGQSEPDPAWMEGGEQPQLGDWQMSVTPADLLRTRPEIAAAEAEVVRAAGEAGVSHADVYPHIGLGSSLDWSVNLFSHHQFIRSGEGIFSAGPVIDMPLFDWGMRLARAHSRDHELSAAVYAYRQAVLQGVAEAETAMGDLQQTHIREDAAERAAQALGSNVSALDKRRELGLASTLDVQDAVIAQQSAQLDVVAARAERDLAYVSLYKALGGAPQPPMNLAAHKARSKQGAK